MIGDKMILGRFEKIEQKKSKNNDNISYNLISKNVHDYIFTPSNDDLIKNCVKLTIKSGPDNNYLIFTLSFKSDLEYKKYINDFFDAIEIECEQFANNIDNIDKQNFLYSYNKEKAQNNYKSEHGIKYISFLMYKKNIKNSMVDLITFEEKENGDIEFIRKGKKYEFIEHFDINDKKVNLNFSEKDSTYTFLGIPVIRINSFNKYKNKENETVLSLGKELLNFYIYKQKSNVREYEYFDGNFLIATSCKK
ncbi:hypothetical protein HDV06_006554 [Boothiomyces sp. JEL0866]|nr:hypothetical protein HDV06_006554 [Boothiomyces sp. JEL0866]